jgi:hypothetical protein
MLEQQMKKLKFWAVAAFFKKYKRAAIKLLFCINKLGLIIVLKTGN